MKRLSLLLLSIFIISLLPKPHLHAQAPRLSIGIPVQGNLSATSTTQDWTIEAKAGDSYAFIANTLSGTLDPTLTVLDEEGAVIAENDDHLRNMVFDAGLDAVQFETAGTYTVQVGRYAGDGDYRLWMLPAYSRIWENNDFTGDDERWDDGRFAFGQDEKLYLETEPEFSIFIAPDGSLPLQNFYLQAQFEWESGLDDLNATAGLVFRVTDDGTRRPPGYYFLIKPNATWSLLSKVGEEFTVLQEDTPSPVLSQTQITLGVWALGSRLRFYANGEYLGEVTDDTFQAGEWGLHARGATQKVRVAVDDLLLTVPTPTTLRFPARLSTWQSFQPNDIVSELQNANVLPDTGERRFIFESQTFNVGAVQVRTYEQLTASEVSGNALVLNLDAYVINGENAGCGINLRYLSDANQVLAFIDVDGGVGLVYIRDGIVRRNTYDILEPVEEPLANGRQRMLIVAVGDVVAFYMNGELFTVEYMPPTSGTVNMALLNYATNAAACGYENMWIWR